MSSNTYFVGFINRNRLSPAIYLYGIEFIIDVITEFARIDRTF